MNEVARSEGKCGSCVPENESQPKTKVLGHACLLCLTLLRFGAWGRVIQNQDGAYFTDVTLVTFPNWLRSARAPTNCLGPPHTS